MGTKITEIVNAMGEAGGDVFLELRITGDCVLWSMERPGQQKVLARWKLSMFESELIKKAGFVD